jgi:hypothetical protein
MEPADERLVDSNESLSCHQEIDNASAGENSSKRQKTSHAHSDEVGTVTPTGNASKATDGIVHEVDKFNPSLYMRFHDPYVNKSVGIRLIPIRNQSGMPMLLQFMKGGRIPPKFGVQVSNQGSFKLNLTFSVPDIKEHESLTGMMTFIVDHAKANRETWWPSENIKPDTIEDNAQGIISKRVPIPEAKKKAGGATEYAGNVKVTIPVDSEGKLKNCIVVDENNAPVSDIYSVMGRNYEKIMMSVDGLYFQKKALGIGPKTLRYLKLAPDLYGNKSAHINYAELVL